MHLVSNSQCGGKRKTRDENRRKDTRKRRKGRENVESKKKKKKKKRRHEEIDQTLRLFNPRKCRMGETDWYSGEFSRA